MTDHRAETLLCGDARSRAAAPCAVLDDPEAKHAVEEEIPIGRMGEPEEIAAAVAWAASGERGYVTGTTIVVAGGISPNSFSGRRRSGRPLPGER